MAYLVYENKIGFPMRLNQVFSFEDLSSAQRFARAYVQGYEDKGMIVENFNGHDWIWYAFDATDLSSGDKGILLQIFNESKLAEGLVIV